VNLSKFALPQIYLVLYGSLGVKIAGRGPCRSMSKDVLLLLMESNEKVLVHQRVVEEMRKWFGLEG
jgi:hypothetical protein